MRTILAFLFLSFICYTSHAQHLMINQDGEKLFIQHEVLAKQNWYTIGRMYNISPKEIAPFNRLSTDKILSIGQELKIPLTENNFVQSGQPAGNEVFIPLYHTVKEKEGLYRISAQYNKVDQKSLKIWNDLKGSDLGKGKDIIVGFLKVKKSVSPLAAEGLTVIPDQKNSKLVQADSKQDPMAGKQEKADSKQDQALVKQEKQTAESVKSPITAKSIEQEKKKDIPSVSKTNSVNTTPAAEQEIAPGTEGFFASAFDEQTRHGKSNVVAGSASLFKTSSGWKDGKYYVLMNSVTPGTIVKVLSKSNGKVVYAKVLGELHAIKENEGLLVRLNSAAVAQLSMNESKFEVSVSY